MGVVAAVDAVDAGVAMEVVAEDVVAEVEAADANADEFRTRLLRLFVGVPGEPVTITQLTHGFEFGFPVDFREFRDEPEDLEFYGEIVYVSPLVQAGNRYRVRAAVEWRQGVGAVRPVVGNEFRRQHQVVPPEPRGQPGH